MGAIPLKAKLLILLLHCNTFIIGQSDTSWYRHYVMDSLETMFPAGIEHSGNDAVLVIGASGKFNDPPDNRNALLRIDGRNGNILWHTRLTQNPVAEASHEFFFIRGLIRLQDGSFIILTNTITETNDIGFSVHRILANGSILWQNDYGTVTQDILANAGGLGIGPDSLSFVVSARRLDTLNQSSTIILYHIDDDGEVLNHLSLNTGLNFYSELSPIVMMEDSSFIVGFNLGNFDLSAQKLLRHINYSGQNIQTHTAWDSGWWSDLKRHQTGQVVAISQAFKDYDNRHKNGLRTTLYTNSLDTVWSMIYNNISGPLFYSEIDFPGSVSFDSQGNILSTGDGSANGGVKPAHLIKYNIDGEILWIKRVGIGSEVGGYLQAISGKIAFQENGILLAGSNILNGVLLVRLDSTGCIIESDCETDILLSSTDVPNNLTFEFRVLPNPANDAIEVSLNEDVFQTLIDPTILIIDIAGHILSSFPLQDCCQQIDLSAIPQGMYLISLQSKGYPLSLQKIIKW
jgi:hypothetical protein